MWKAKVSIIIIVSVMLAGCSQSVQNQSEALLYTEEIVKEELETTVVQKKTYVQEAFANASVYYTKQSVISMNIADATLETIEVKIGDKVRKGDVVATYKVDFSKAEMERQRMRIQNARLAYRSSYTSLLNRINEQKRKVKNAASSQEKLQQKNILNQLNEQLKQKKNEEQAINRQESALQSRISRASQTKLYSKYNGIVTDVMDLGAGEDVNEYGYDGAGRDIVTLRTGDDFLIEIDHTGFSTAVVDLLRYNTEVTIALGSDRNDIHHRMKGKVISSENLVDDDIYDLYSDELDDGYSESMIRISKADQKKYSFKKTNIYVEYERLRMDDCLVVDQDAIYQELDGEEIKSGERYGSPSGDLRNLLLGKYGPFPFYQPEEWILQGVEEGQVLAMNANVER